MKCIKPLILSLTLICLQAIPMQPPVRNVAPMSFMAPWMDSRPSNAWNLPPHIYERIAQQAELLFSRYLDLIDRMPLIWPNHPQEQRDFLHFLMRQNIRDFIINPDTPIASILKERMELFLGFIMQTPHANTNQWHTEFMRKWYILERGISEIQRKASRL